MKSFEINVFDNIVHIKKYKKILSTSSSCIIIEFIDRNVKISGELLIVVGMDEYEVCIRGNVYNIEFLYE